MALMTDENNELCLQIGRYKIKLDLEDLDEETKKKAEKELRETPENVENALAELRALIKNDVNLFVAHESDEFLKKFLRPCKFYPKSAFNQIHRFYKYKLKHPDFCNDLMPSKLRNSFCQGMVNIQETRDFNGSRIIHIQSGHKWKPKEVTVNEMFRLVQLMFETAMMEPKTQVNGVVLIVDMKGLEVNHVTQITPSLAKTLVDWFQDSIPLRLKSIHVINQPTVFNMLMALMKPFLKEKLRKKLHIHNENSNSILKYIPADALSTEYGGSMDMPEVDGNLLCDLLCKYEEHYIVADSFGYKKNKTK